MRGPYTAPPNGLHPPQARGRRRCPRGGAPPPGQRHALALMTRRRALPPLVGVQLPLQPGHPAPPVVRTIGMAGAQGRSEQSAAGLVWGGVGSWGKSR
jgi:hypothetical protein